MKKLLLALALATYAVPAQAWTYHLVAQWIEHGQRFCKYSNGEVLNVGVNFCPYSIERPW